MKKDNYYDIITSPVISEKSTFLSESDKVVFNVPLDVSKSDIKLAIEKLFDVKVKTVNTLIRKGKTKRFRGFMGKQKSVKKAFVTLADGKSIDMTMGL